MLPVSAKVLALVLVSALPLSATTQQAHYANVPTNVVSIRILNKSLCFRDLRIGGHTYTVLPNDTMTVQAPAGTLVLAGSALGKVHRGDLIVEMDRDRNNTTVVLR